MRSSSIKSVAITVATIATLTITAFPAAARQNNTQPGSGATAVRNAVAAVKRVYSRFITPVLNGLPVIPIPAPETQNGTQTTRTGNSNQS